MRAKRARHRSLLDQIRGATAAELHHYSRPPQESGTRNLGGPRAPGSLSSLDSRLTYNGRCRSHIILGIFFPWLPPQDDLGPAYRPSQSDNKQRRGQAATQAKAFSLASGSDLYSCFCFFVFANTCLLALPAARRYDYVSFFCDRPSSVQPPHHRGTLGEALIHTPGLRSPSANVTGRTSGGTAPRRFSAGAALGCSSIECLPTESPSHVTTAAADACAVIVRGRHATNVRRRSRNVLDTERCSSGHRPSTLMELQGRLMFLDAD